MFFFPYHDDNPTERFPWLTILLIIINVFVHIRLTSLPEEEMELRYFQYGFVPVRLTQVFTGQPVAVDARLVPDQLHNRTRTFNPFRTLFGAEPEPDTVVLQPEPAVRVIRSMFTSMFLHGSFMHLIGNMWFFWIFGNNVEDRLGPLRFLMFYLLGGLAAGFVHYLSDPFSPVITIGASGAISAAMGAYMITWPRAVVRCLTVFLFYVTTVEIPAIVFIGFWFLVQIFSAVMSESGAVGGVAWWAHIGGFVAGIFLMQALTRTDSEG